MATCKDCLHYKVCEALEDEVDIFRNFEVVGNIYDNCELLKDYLESVAEKAFKKAIFVNIDVPSNVDAFDSKE